MGSHFCARIALSRQPIQMSNQNDPFGVVSNLAKIINCLRKKTDRWQSNLEVEDVDLDKLLVERCEMSTEMDSRTG